MRRARPQLWLVVAIAAIVALTVFVTIVDTALSHNRIHPGVAVSGHDVGRMTREEAVATLDKLVRASQQNRIVLAGGRKSWSVAPTDVGTKIDVKRTVADAYAIGRDGNALGNMVRRLKLYFSHRDVALHGAVNESSMKHLLAKVAKTLDAPAVNADVKVDGGNVTVSEGRGGRIVDQPALRTQLEGLLFSLHATQLPVPMKNVRPAIEAAETKAATAQVKTMISAPVKLTYKDQTWTASIDSIERYIDFEVVGTGANARLVAVISPEKAGALFEEASSAVDRKPKNATWVTDGETAGIIPAQTGRTVDKKQTAAALTTAALSTTKRTAALVVKEVKPARSTEKAKSMGIRAVLGTYSTEFGGSENRRDNVQLAAEKIDGTILAPGEQFDFDSVVGQRSAQNGFKTAPAIVSGGKLEDTLGGGICQVATTLFNAVFFAGLDVTARSNHSLYISHYPKGRDAAVNWGSKAFRFVNDTPNFALIRSAANRSSLTFTIYGTPQGRKVTYATGDWYDIDPATVEKRETDALAAGETQVVQDGQTGRKVKVTRTVKLDGKTIHKDVFLSSYPMLPEIIEVGTAVATTTTTESRNTTTTKPKAKTTTTTSAATTTTTAQ